MELKELRTFCVAVKLRSISKAAERLGIGQPTATTHIKSLEKELGITLFDRVKRPIQPTLAGARLAELTHPLLREMDELVGKIGELEEEGPVRIAATHDLIPHTLLAVVKAFMGKHPHVHLRMRSATRNEVVKMVEEMEVDIGVLPGPELAENLHFQGMFTYERVLITPKEHPLSNEKVIALEQIAKWPLVLMGPRTRTRHMLETEFQRRGLSYDIIMELDSVDVIKRYVALGLGISVGPKLAIDPKDYEELGIAPLTTLLPVEQAGVITLPGRTLSKPAQDFIQVMQDTVAARVATR